MKLAVICILGLSYYFPQPHFAKINRVICICCSKVSRRVELKSIYINSTWVSRLRVIHEALVLLKWTSLHCGSFRFYRRKSTFLDKGDFLRETCRQVGPRGETFQDWKSFVVDVLFPPSDIPSDVIEDEGSKTCIALDWTCRDKHFVGFIVSSRSTLSW